MTGGTKFSKRELKKEIERDLATKAREALAKLKEKIDAARARRRAVMIELQKQLHDGVRVVAQLAGQL